LPLSEQAHTAKSSASEQAATRKAASVSEDEAYARGFKAGFAQSSMKD